MCFYILSWYNTREKLNWYIFNFNLANKHLIQFIATPEHTSINIIKHGRNVRWAAAARILKNPASARWCRRSQNQEALELDAEATRVRSREVRLTRRKSEQEGRRFCRRRWWRRKQSCAAALRYSGGIHSSSSPHFPLAVIREVMMISSPSLPRQPEKV